MEKFIFLATIKDKLAEMNLPQESIDKHVKIFDDCFKGKNAEEIDAMLESAGGVEGIIKSIQNLEIVKQKRAPKSPEPFIKTKSDGNVENVEGTTTSPDLKSKIEVSEEVPTYAEQEQADNELPTMEMPKAPNIDKHIQEAEELSETMERIPVQPVVNEEFSAEISDYDFELLFQEKLTKIESSIKNLRKKLSSKTYKATLPIALIITALVFVLVSALFPILVVSAAVFSIAYICLLVAGVCFAIVPIGYGIYMCFKSMPIALYELGIGIISSGITMFSCILLYNYVKRLVPYLFKKLIKLFKYCIKLTKRYFGKQVKEEA